MTNSISYCENRADLAVLVMHLSSCDDLFQPRLSDRVDVVAYAKKLFKYSMRFEAWYEQVLVGLVAAYCSDEEKRSAFVTNVSVLQEWQGQGIAAHLLENCLGRMRLQGVQVLELEVDQRNHAAVALYHKFGFDTKRNDGTLLSMKMNHRSLG